MSKMKEHFHDLVEQAAAGDATDACLLCDAADEQVYEHRCGGTDPLCGYGRHDDEDCGCPSVERTVHEVSCPAAAVLGLITEAVAA